MEEELKEAVLFAKSLKKHGARRRQLQYIGALMRKTDISPIKKSLELISFGQKIDNQNFMKVEKWRDGLISGDGKTFKEIIAFFPNIDRQHLNQLIRNANKEEKKGKPPKSSRQLFRYLKNLLEKDE